jgi:LysR family nitrogen assimilation transcriptional regulator
MDLRQLEYFVRVAETGSFSKAASALSVSQPFISKCIRQIEQEMDARFFRRHSRGIALTEEGSVFYSRVKNVLEQMSGAREDLASLKNSPTGTVVLGTVSAVGPVLAVDLVTRFSERFPRATLKIIEAKSWEVYEWLVTGRVDLGVLNDPKERDDMEITPLIQRELCLVSAESQTRFAPGQAVKFSQLADLPLILPGHPHPMRELIDGVAARVGIRLTSAHDIIGKAYNLELVRKGLGYTLLTRYSADKIKAANRLQTNEIVDPGVATTLAVAVAARPSHSQLAHNTAKLVGEIMLH